MSQETSAYTAASCVQRLFLLADFAPLMRPLHPSVKNRSLISVAKVAMGEEKLTFQRHQAHLQSLCTSQLEDFSWKAKSADTASAQPHQDSDRV